MPVEAASERREWWPARATTKKYRNNVFGLNYTLNRISVIIVTTLTIEMQNQHQNYISIPYPRSGKDDHKQSDVIIWPLQRQPRGLMRTVNNGSSLSLGSIRYLQLGFFSQRSLAT